MSPAAEGRQRHRFVVVVPVADRPQQLAACLDSLLELCRLYGCGSEAGDRVTVLIADDSCEADNIQRHKQLAARCNAQGVHTDYFGLEEQQALLGRIQPDRRAALAGVLGEGRMGHKGASAMRNIVYLRLAAMADDRTLFWFIDSDQTFQVRMNTPEGERDAYAIDYFRELERIFSTTDALVVTGKVVGDPPVSPSVMAANFLADVEAFLHTLAGLDLQDPCCFHVHSASADDAAYHDMASLFGFAERTEVFNYPCPLHGDHTNADALAHFARQLNGFFHGEHPTRKSRYEHQDALVSLKPARTVYTGNYCFRPEALRYFIPFASLKLRMAGPVLGRLLKQELGKLFVSANLPMLHARTLNAGEHYEFRPGVDRQDDAIDLSGELERQFYGDVMLFTIEKLAALGYPAQIPDDGQIAQAYDETLQEIARQYAAKREQIDVRLQHLSGLVRAGGRWQEAAGAQFARFLANIERNFGAASSGYAAIEGNAGARRQEMLRAIGGYPQERNAWETVLAQANPETGCLLSLG
jgi:hypothetical protein